MYKNYQIEPEKIIISYIYLYQIYIKCYKNILLYKSIYKNIADPGVSLKKSEKSQKYVLN